MRSSSSVTSFLLLLGVIFFSSTTVSAECKNLENFYKTLSPTTVWIKSEYAYSNKTDHNTHYTFISGSGVFITSDGWILTTDHLLSPILSGNPEYKRSASYVIYNGRNYKSRVVSIDPELEFGIIKIDPNKDEVFPFAPIGNTSDLSIGQCVFSIGNPLGFKKVLRESVIGSFTHLGVNGVKRKFEYRLGSFIFTNLNITHGDSGGPVFNHLGQLIGIGNFSINIESLSGIALISKSIRTSIDHAIRNQALERSTFRVSFFMQDLVDLGLINEKVAMPEQLAKRTELKIPSNLTEGVILYNPSQSGFLNGDVIIELDQKPVGSIQSFLVTVAAIPPGKSVKFKLYRDGKLIEFYTVLDVIKVVTP